MSRPQRRGKLRNPPRARQYALYTVAIVVLVSVGSTAFLYTTHDYGVFPASSTASSASSTSSSSGTSSGAISTVAGQGSAFAFINTTQGVIEAQLYPTVAPKTVANFENLSSSGFYNNLVWHRIVKGFAIQTGDPTSKNGGGVVANWGQHGSNQTVPLEASAATVAQGFTNSYGSFGVARSTDLNSGSSQFFINLANNTSLDGQYTVFGKVIRGMNVAVAIGNLPVNPACASSQGLNCPPLNPTGAEVLSITIRDTP
jgi:cyclophilin family peptidyl-prolyl cis-trans isomerase